MTQQLPTESIAAIATIIASLIAAAISFVNLTLTKEQKTSEFRQAWIDALREDLSSFLQQLVRSPEQVRSFSILVRETRMVLRCHSRNKQSAIFDTE